MNIAEHNLRAALEFLEHWPQARLFYAVWKDGRHVPQVKWSTECTADPAVLARWLRRRKGSYACVAARASGLAIVDIDRKNGKDGEAELAELEFEHGPLPRTLQASTPSGNGTHLVFAGEMATGANRIAHGVDSVVMIPVPGSHVAGKGDYTVTDPAPIVPVPDWVREIAGAPVVREDAVGEALVELDMQDNIDWAVSYLVDNAPLAIEGDGGDATALQVALRVRDAGVSVDMCRLLMHEHYADKCSPYSSEWLDEKISNAYRYARSPAGNDAPQAEFKAVDEDEVKVDHPEEEDPIVRSFNEKYCVVKMEGAVRIYEEHPHEVRLMKRADFELATANVPPRIYTDPVSGKDKSMPASQWWLRHKRRREADRLVFAPGVDEPGAVNLWRGFALEPHAGDDYADKCRMYREHVEKIVCSGDKTIIEYVWAWMADLVKHPGGDKPGVALVMRGGRGTGKGAFTRPLQRIFGQHFIALSNRAQLMGRFNSHLGAKVVAFLDEAYWSGDKSAESVLKALVTEPRIAVEKKGVDVIELDSYLRIIMASNEDWVVPAGVDERRYLVLDVAETKQQNTRYFGKLFAEMDNGGSAALMRWLLEYDGPAVDLRKAPNTGALQEQKMESLGTVEQWIYYCLEEGCMPGINAQEWPTFIPTADMHDAFVSWATKMRAGYIDRPLVFTRKVVRIFPSWRKHRLVPDGEITGVRKWGYTNQGLAESKNEFLRYVGSVEKDVDDFLE